MLMLIGIIFMIKISFTFYNKISQETERLQLKSLPGYPRSAGRGSDSNYRTVPVPEFLFDEIRERRYLNEGILLRYPGLAEEGALCLGPYGKVKTLPTLNTRLKKITQSYGLPRISLGDLRYMYLADLIKKEKQFKKIMELFGYANPYRMLNLCQQIADIQGDAGQAIGLCDLFQSGIQCGKRIDFSIWTKAQGAFFGQSRIFQNNALIQISPVPDLIK